MNAHGTPKFSTSSDLPVPSRVPLEPVAPLSVAPPESLDLPGRFHVERSVGVVRIAWSWRNWRHLMPFAIFVGVWDVFTAIGLMSGKISPLFFFTHGLTGLLSTYGLLAYAVNATTVEVRGGWIDVRKGPLPWTRGCTLRVDEIDQLEAVASETHVNGRALADVRVRTRDGRAQLLVGSLDDTVQAQRLTTLLQHALHDAATPSMTTASHHRPGDNAR